MSDRLVECMCVGKIFDINVGIGLEYVVLKMFDMVCSVSSVLMVGYVCNSVNIG